MFFFNLQHGYPYCFNQIHRWFYVLAVEGESYILYIYTIAAYLPFPPIMRPITPIDQILNQINFSTMLNNMAMSKF